ncbi:MAG: alpha/beta hydrolase [Candidatus Geothermincolia bacterium]
MRHARIRWLTAAALVLALALSGAIVGCGSGGMVDVNSYSVKQSGKAIGSQQVKIEETGDGVVYTGTEKRPLAVFDTSYARTLTVAKDLRSMISYKSSRKVPGATYTTDMASAEQGFSFFSDDLQVYSYVPLLPQGKSVIALEADSACLMQALLDRFLSAGVTQASAFVVVPSRGPVVRQISLDRRTQYQVIIQGQGLGEVEVAFDKNKFVTSIRTGDLMVQKGSAGSVSSKAFQPETKAGRVEAVRVKTPDKSTQGESVELVGSLYFPRSGTKPYQAVILTGDAGPQDETGGGFLSQIADSLAGKGFAVLACARRGVPESTGSYATTTRKTLVADLNLQVDYLVNRGDINKDTITLLGYGEGGLLSAGAAVANPYVKRLVLMATPSVTMFPDLANLEFQLAAQRGSILAEEAAFGQENIASLVADISGTTEVTAQVGGHKVFLDWMRSWIQATPSTDFAGLKVPVLVMQGTADGVVPPAQASDIMNVLGARAGGVQKLESFDGLGHAFGKELTESQSIPYRQHPVVDAKVLDALGTWLSGQK